MNFLIFSLLVFSGLFYNVGCLIGKIRKIFWIPLLIVCFIVVIFDSINHYNVEKEPNINIEEQFR